MSRAASIREALFLVKNGIPFDVAFTANDAMRIAFVVALREIEGAKFDWSTMSFKECK